MFQLVALHAQVGGLSFRIVDLRLREGHVHLRRDAAAEPIFCEGQKLFVGVQGGGQQFILHVVGQQVEVAEFERPIAELERQIEVLDNIYEENLEFDNRLNRVKQGLIIILRRAMMNKLTRFLAILLLLAVVALIVLYVLKSNNVIT